MCVCVCVCAHVHTNTHPIVKITVNENELKDAIYETVVDHLLAVLPLAFLHGPQQS